MTENIFIGGSSKYEDENKEEPSIILTRYLYNKKEVIVSLKISLFDRNVEEAMFWGYELYFSGFKYDVFKELNDIYEIFYKLKNPSLGKYLNKMIIKWDDDKSQHSILGTIIKNMALRPISLTYMLEQRHGLPHNVSQYNENDKNIFIQIQEEEIKHLYTIETIENNRFSSEGRATESSRNTTPYERRVSLRTWKLLRNVCKYTIRREAMDIFETSYQDFNYTNLDNWLYFASFSPIWKLRIEKYKGIQNHQTNTIDFEENDDTLEDFYENYGYEPDEQPKEVLEKILYINPKPQLSWADFCDKYGKDSVLSKVVILIKRHTNKL